MAGSAQDEWFTAREFAVQLKVSLDTVHKWSASGAGSGAFPHFIKLPNGSIRIRRDWLDQWIEERYR